MRRSRPKKLLRRVVRKFGELNVANSVLQDLNRPHTLDLDHLAHNREIQRRLRGGSKESHEHRRPRLPSQPADDLVDVATGLHRLPINAHNLVAAPNSRPFARCTREGRDDNDSVLPHLHLDTDAAKLPREILLELRVVLLLQEFGMRIERLDHAMECIARQTGIVGGILVNIVLVHQPHHVLDVSRGP